MIEVYLLRCYSTQPPEHSSVIQPPLGWCQSSSKQCLEVMSKAVIYCHRFLKIKIQQIIKKQHQPRRRIYEDDRATHDNDRHNGGKAAIHQSDAAKSSI